MNCREMIDFLTAYVEGDLPEVERATFERHIGQCAPCKTYLDSYRKAIELGKAACCCGNLPTCDDVPESLIQAILAARRAGA
ncbi:MAG: zf-HC2 domain-containing protein [Phycisphaeraceae bacterium]|nr:zf-HC2 domain-containing protein [Phycisphaerales bacterium]QOJ17501.1 MAG: zf-HC2 domain-containing protein [Phycisphaeraceae bacterium]